MKREYIQEKSDPDTPLMISNHLNNAVMKLHTIIIQTQKQIELNPNNLIQKNILQINLERKQNEFDKLWDLLITTLADIDSDERRKERLKSAYNDDDKNEEKKNINIEEDQKQGQKIMTHYNKFQEFIQTLYVNVLEVLTRVMSFPIGIMIGYYTSKYINKDTIKISQNDITKEDDDNSEHENTDTKDEACKVKTAQDIFYEINNLNEEISDVFDIFDIYDNEKSNDVINSSEVANYEYINDNNT